MQGWMLSWKNIDPHQNFSRTYRKKATAYKDAAESIKGWAEYEIENIRLSKDEEERAEDLARFQEMVDLVAKKKHEDAYDLWREYADDANSDDDVLIEDTEIV